MPRPAIPTLPLTARKNVRDEWESKKQDLELKLSSILGEIWTIEVNFLELHAYADDSYAKEDPGGIAARFIEFGLEKLVYFAKAHGESGKAELNATTYTHRIVITADDTGNVKYSGCDLKAGTLRILFNENHYGYWQDNALSCLDEALDLASQASSQFSFLPRSTIKQHYDPEIGAVQSKIAGMLKLDDLVLNPYSEDNAKKLAKEPPYSEWRREYGTTLLHVFQQAAAGLEEAKFGEDDMLREALVEALEKKEIGIRVVDKLTKSSKNEVVIEKGVLYLQFEPGSWSYDITSRMSDLINIL